MKSRFLITGILLWSIPLHILAAPTVFDLYFEEVGKNLPSSPSEEKLRQFVVDEMRGWKVGEEVVDISLDDVKAVELHNFTQLCGERYDNVLAANDCLQLERDIRSVIDGERESQALANDLIAITTSAELSTMDEPHHPIHLGRQSLLIERLLSGTGTHVFPWPTNNANVTSLLQKIDGQLAGSKRDDFVYRYHYGYFKSLHEADSRFVGTGGTMGNLLKDLAKELGITGDPKRKGEFITPKLSTNNVSLWARGDDLGLAWIYPEKFFRFQFTRAGSGTYPEFNTSNSGSLSYPFEYAGTGSTITWKSGTTTPVCARSGGALGYLCRKMQGIKNCQRPFGTSANVVLAECDEQIIERKGPEICSGQFPLFSDTGLPFIDPLNSQNINPNLSKAAQGSVCQPDKKISYKDEIIGHACYISSCIAESLSGHTIIPGRNPSILGELTAPFLACARPDPELGIFAELSAPAVYNLPQYVGNELVQDLEVSYCGKNGLAPQLLPALCAYGTSRRTNSPLRTREETVIATDQELRSLHEDQTHLLWQAAGIGERRAIDQALPIYKKIISSFGQNIKELAHLFLELTQAPITKTACPWTGPFRTSYPSSSSSSS